MSKSRANNRGCCNYDPWRVLNAKPKVSQERKDCERIWREYLEQTQEMREAWSRGVLTLEQMQSFCAPFLRQYQEQLTAIKGDVSFRIRLMSK